MWATVVLFPEPVIPNIPVCLIIKFFIFKSTINSLFCKFIFPKGIDNTFSSNEYILLTSSSSGKNTSSPGTGGVLVFLVIFFHLLLLQ